MALINTTTTGVLGSTFYGDGAGPLTVQQNGVQVAKLANQPMFSAYFTGTTSGQALTHATFTNVTFNVIEYDTANCYNTSTYRWTPNVAGYYFIQACCYAQFPSVTGQILIALNKNNANYKYGNYSYANSTYTDTSSLVQTMIYLNGTTDYVSVQAYQNTGSTKYIYGSLNHSYFSGCLVKAE